MTRYVVWSFLKKYGSKKLKSEDDDLKLVQQVLSTICLTDPDRRRYCTVNLGKDNSPSSDDETEGNRSVHVVEPKSVLSYRSSGRFLEVQLVVGHLDSSSFHP